ncbi:hypothetical protein [Paenibacillus sp. S28]|nr:hypothetical protein [Paenibacillus sp. S28]
MINPQGLFIIETKKYTWEIKGARKSIRTS